MAKDKEPFYKGVNFKQFTNKDGYLKVALRLKYLRRFQLRIKLEANVE